MKTKNNVQKTVLRTGAVIISFVLISLTVTAQEFWKAVLTKSSFNQIALAMVETSKKSSNQAAASDSSLNTEMYLTDYESKLSVENWMKDESNFSEAEIQTTAKDENLVVEDWMLDESIFAAADETESPLKVESWMKDSRTWEN